MYLDPKAAAQMLKAGLGKAMRDRDVLVIAYDHNTDQQIYPARMIQGAEEHIDAVGWHCYGGQWGDYSASKLIMLSMYSSITSLTSDSTNGKSSLGKEHVAIHDRVCLWNPLLKN
jgi:O-glycosyl hydrolase